MLVNPINLSDINSLFTSHESEINRYEELDEIPFHYTTQKADEGFVSELENMSVDNFMRLSDSPNFFEIGEYTLYEITYSKVGSSKVYVENQKGERLLILDSEQPIYQIGFWDRENIVIELVNSLHYEGYNGQIYLLNLKDGILFPIESGKTGSGLSYFYKIYKSRLYYFTESKKSQNSGEAYDIYINYPNGTSDLIMEYVQMDSVYTQPQFVGERVYYLNHTRDELYSFDLNGDDLKKEYSFNTPVQKVYMYADNEHGVYIADNHSYLLKLSDYEFQQMLYDTNIKLDQDGYFSVNKINELQYTSYNSKATITIISNIPTNIEYYLLNENLYFTTQQYYYKVDLSTGTITFLS